MVMPRARSSGALSMESKLRNEIFGLCLARTLVMAAVSVVLPWSTWPMVPMLTWGFDRSNRSFAMFSRSLFLRDEVGGMKDERNVSLHPLLIHPSSLILHPLLCH